ncbi:hypothetical protein C8A05DRAFT_39283 [Staphylotrichum tortipilum]|uniref:Protein kinase domain-containing protein n=1 Tax=Staphylotrichum tortipilum TaxID=2831512 RepID=A0AAN6RMX1_9PEZI|nr:hypothetical protein C8A05DRAFT_39283 [Staphylotrichum longicolle]
MDITPAIIHRILLPLSATFDDDLPLSATLTNNFPLSPTPTISPSTTSSLSYTIPTPNDTSITWTIDTGTPSTLTFLALPHFARHRPPLYIPVVILPDETPLGPPTTHLAIPPSLAPPFHFPTIFATSKPTLPSHPLSTYLLTALSYWSTTTPNFEQRYLSLPYGSKILVDRLPPDPREARIHLWPCYELERAWLSLRSFEEQTGVGLEMNGVGVVELEGLELVRWFEEVVVLVRVKSWGGKVVVYKAVGEAGQVGYMYHELRVLVGMGGQRGVVGRPLGVVVKRCRFGGKVGVCGFLEEYYGEHGSLQRVLGDPVRRAVGLGQKVGWLRELALALVYVRDHGPGFYSDLKPSNVLLVTREDGCTAPLLIDFEQRGSWYSWSPPEVQFVEFLDMLATKASSASTRERYSEILYRCIHGWSPQHQERPLSAAPQGYSLGWTALDQAGQQRAQMFGLGKMMWCVLEELPSCNTFVSIETLAEGIDQRQRFPEFDKTPAELRELIRRCTASAPEWKGKGFPAQRRGNKLVPVEPRAGTGEVPDSVYVQRLAREWWRKRVKDAENYVKNYGVGGSVTTNAVNAEVPTLEEVVDILINFSATVP